MRRLIAMVILTGCSAADGPNPNSPVPDFSLEDVNATSDRFGTEVSPSDLQKQISGWYFGHAT